MRFKIVIFLFGLMFLTGFSEAMGYHKLKILEQKISGKEIELEKLKVLHQEVLEKKENMERPPKIGLVLSGGGAKGAAHVGVLKILEEYNIHIDYITGTSFGSIVGALYAAGYTADEIEKIILNIDWDSFKNDNQARKYTSIVDKDKREKYCFNLEIDENWKLKFPKGVLTGRAFYLELKSLFIRVEEVDDFDNLQIPFRAIATNINTGERQAIGKGDLAKAVFMSMTIPTIFEPVKDDGEFYIDGGLVDNLPVQEVLNMGADIVIAVDISADETIIKENSNLVEIMDKISTYRSEKEFKEATELADILIVPDVKKTSVADFSNLETLIEMGERETKKHREELVKLSRSKSKKTPESKDINNEEIEFEIDEVVLVGNKSVTKEKILGISRKGIPGNYTQEELNLWMNKINALYVINRSFYRIEDKKLTIEIQETETRYLRLGINASSDFGAAIGIATEISTYGLLDNDYMVTAEISKYPKLEFRGVSEYNFKEIQYLSSIGFGAKANPLFIYDKADKISEYANESVYIDGILGTAVFNSYSLGTKIEYIMSKNEYESGSKEFKSKSSWDYYKGYIFIKSDSRDDSHFSDEGVKNDLSLFTGGDIEGSGSVEFSGLLFDMHQHIPIKEKFNLELFISGGKMDGTEIPENEYFKIGGLRNDLKTNLFSFYGMNAMRKYAEEFYMAGINLRYKLNASVYINMKYNTVTYDTPTDLIITEDSKAGENFKHGVGIGLGWDSLVGPLEIVVSNDSDARGMLLSAFFGYEF
ncbi:MULTISPECIES: patatin-like phospholipase family protein [Psychrilyobacter]|uniref:PNPLA domain-containing protein n=1 Tax=Psychrilyobacter piezotolerans TaxID=2293438 RepID=A0ABX9KK65_9FUSO|nr:MULTISPECIES: patatin-like phospholipase family protein [Psychrilyobacter]MCS5420566.1 patatin-like phospholipase family protein [Psychrilyobacter sp. S5]NDI76638.1 BamA/TamA family outer membrane protein [Psychrilyobacter piezotolerans]RDE65264.1 hypothetical protein DV867_01675 [Psychrilyobacter sp. S5]REI42882.1 hypothetical protein DYH56_01675 [Psychrilyobacter piezotolerans]